MEDDDFLFLTTALLAGSSTGPVRKRKRRRLWSRQLLIERPLRGEFVQLMERERQIEPATFYGAYRMNPATFDELLTLVGPCIERQTTTFRNPVGAPERLGLTLRYLATGMSQKDVARHFCVGRSTACTIIKNVCQAIWDVLAPLYIPKPSTEDWKKIAEGFENRLNFPHCLGGIDGKHILIQKPGLTGSKYFNYKKNFSMVFMAVADSKYRFIYVDVGSYGREHDASVFAQSEFGQRLEANTLQLPQAEDGELPYVFVGDEAFPLKPQLLRPYPAVGLTDVKAVYNYRLSRARRVVENAFGIMVTKWRILRQPIIAKPEKADVIMKAISTLHNFMLQKEGFASEPEELGEADIGLRNIGRLGANMYSRVAGNVRDSFADYFSSPQGSLPFQDQIIHRGQIHRAT